MNDLKLNDDRETLKCVLENAVPKTLQDVVLIYTSVTGLRKGDLFEENFCAKDLSTHDCREALVGYSGHDSCWDLQRDGSGI